MTGHVAIRKKKRKIFQLHHFIMSDSKVKSDDARHAEQYPQLDCCVWINLCLAAEWKIMTSSTVVTWQIDQCVYLLAALTGSGSHVLYFSVVIELKKL